MQPNIRKRNKKDDYIEVLDVEENTIADSSLSDKALLDKWMLDLDDDVHLAEEDLEDNVEEKIFTQDIQKKLLVQQEFEPIIIQSKDVLSKKSNEWVKKIIASMLIISLWFIWTKIIYSVFNKNNQTLSKEPNKLELHNYWPHLKYTLNESSKNYDQYSYKVFVKLSKELQLVSNELVNLLEDLSNNRLYKNKDKFLNYKWQIVVYWSENVVDNDFIKLESLIRTILYKRITTSKITIQKLLHDVIISKYCFDRIDLQEFEENMTVLIQQIKDFIKLIKAYIQAVSGYPNKVDKLIFELNNIILDEYCIDFSIKYKSELIFLFSWLNQLEKNRKNVLWFVYTKEKIKDEVSWITDKIEIMIQEWNDSSKNLIYKKILDKLKEFLDNVLVIYSRPVPPIWLLITRLEEYDKWFFNLIWKFIQL